MTRLGLCSAAAPEASLDELIAACTRRGLAALELREGDGHGIDPDGGADLAAALDRATHAGITVVGYRSARQDRDARLARLAGALEVPLLVDGPADIAGRVERAGRLIALGADVVVALPAGASTRDATSCIRAGADIAWDADPARAAMADRARSLLRSFGPRLRGIRLLGGGPEATMQEGKGIGALMACLALERFDGPVVLAPSSGRYHVAWRMWLGRGRGWGCGSKSAGSSPLPLMLEHAVSGDAS